MDDFSTLGFKDKYLHDSSDSSDCGAYFSCTFTDSLVICGSPSLTFSVASGKTKPMYRVSASLRTSLFSPVKSKENSLEESEYTFPVAL